MYINYTTLHSVVHITYSASVIVPVASLYTDNKVRNWLFKTPLRPVHQLYNPETCCVHNLHLMSCNGPSGKFEHLQQGNLLIVENPLADCTSTVQLWNFSCTLPPLH